MTLKNVFLVNFNMGANNCGGCCTLKQLTYYLYLHQKL